MTLPEAPNGATASERLAVKRKIDRYPVEPTLNRAQWMELRSRDVTASVCAALLGAHPYITALELWAEKAGKIPPDEAETGAMARGRRMEDVAVDLIRDEHPEWEVFRPAVYLRDPAARLGATPDLFVTCPTRGPGVVQIKSVEPGAFRRSWRDPDSGEVSPPLYAAVQAIIEAHLAGAAWAAVAALVIGHRIDLHIVDAPIHTGVIDRIKAATAKFWSFVEHGEMPPADFGRDGDVLARLYPEDDGSEVDWTTDNRAPELVAALEAARAEKSGAEARAKAATAELLAKIGKATWARLPDGRLLAVKTVRRGPYQVEASRYRAIRVVKPRELQE